MAAVVFDPYILALTRLEHDLEIAQVHLPLDAVGLLGREAPHAADKVEQTSVVQVGVLVVLLLDRAVHQRHGGRIGHAVVGGLVSARLPLVGAVRHDMDRCARHADVYLLDLARVGDKRPCFDRRLCHSL